MPGSTVRKRSTSRSLGVPALAAGVGDGTGEVGRVLPLLPSPC
ncbi:hypothetical protein ACFU3E_26420 [Streptomyces sp. NPDC057424]